MLAATEIIAREITVHYHHSWIIWIIFLFGQALHALLQIDTIARNNKVTRASIFYQNWVRILYRVSASSVAFGIIWLHPQTISGILGVFGIHIGGDESQVFALPINNTLALGYGLCLDSLFGYVPFLKNLVPDVSQWTMSVSVTSSNVHEPDKKEN
jgi:hypothetical protein